MSDEIPSDIPSIVGPIPEELRVMVREEIAAALRMHAAEMEPLGPGARIRRMAVSLRRTASRITGN